MEDTSSYSEAVTALQTPRLLAPVYFIVAGTKPSEVRNLHLVVWGKVSWENLAGISEYQFLPNEQKDQ